MFVRTLKIKGKNYYSLVESRRIDGKTKQVILSYLGTDEALYEKLKRGGVHVTNMDYYVDMVSMHVFILTLLQTIAFAVLNAISWR